MPLQIDLVGNFEENNEVDVQCDFCRSGSKAGVKQDCRYVF